MQKNRKVNLIFSLVMIVLTACNLTSALQQTGTPAAPDQGSPTLAPPSIPGIASLGSASAADLVRQIMQPDSSLIQGFEAVQEALARGGIATMDLNGVYVAAYPPASPMPETHANILAMTLEVRNHAHRATLDELAQMLKDLGWPFSPDSTPGEQLVSFMAAWIGAARNNPSDPQSFTPLFIAEMAQRQVQPVDLSSDSADPTRVRLGMLEIVLFSAAFDRNMVVPQSSIPPGQKEARSTGLTMVRFTLPNQEEGPCTRFKRFFYGDLSSAILPDPLGKQLGDFVFSYTFGDVLNKAVESRGWDAETFGKAMAAMNVLGRISKLVELYSSLSVSVAVQGENPVHKPLDVESEKEVIFDATVGVSEEDWSDYQQKNGELGMTIDRIGRDCMSVLGLPTIANTGDIAQAVQGFKVEWEIVSGSPEHGYDAREDEQDLGCKYHQGKLRCSVAPVSDHSGKSSFMIDVIQNKQPETQAVHESGDLVSSKIEVCAQVDASEPPNLSTFINGAMGGVGLADPVAELLSGMILKLGKPEGCAEPPLEVTWHAQRDYQITVKVSGAATEIDEWYTYSREVEATFTVIVHPNTPEEAEGSGEMRVAEVFTEKYYPCSSDVTVPATLYVLAGINETDLVLSMRTDPLWINAWCWWGPVEEAPYLVAAAAYIKLNGTDPAVTVFTQEVPFSDYGNNLVLTWEVTATRLK